MRLIGSNAVTTRIPVFAPCGHHEKNAASLCWAEVEVTFLPFDDFYSDVHRIVEDDLLRLFWPDAVASHMANVGLVPIELNLPSIHGFLLSIPHL